MNASPNVIRNILHPTDFSDASLNAFHHALKAALMSQSGLALLHVNNHKSGEIMEFPGVRETLERWGLLPKGSSRSDVPQLGIDVRKVVAKQGSPVNMVLHYLEDHPADLIVLATRQHEGRMSWLKQSIGGSIARHSEQMTLFVPEGIQGFVSSADGAVRLENILIPVADTPGPQSAVDAVARLVQRLKCPAGVFTLLHLGNDADMPEVRCPEVPGWRYEKVCRSGDVIRGILDSAHTVRADLLVMATDGRSNFLEALRGSHTERVLKEAPAPLLTIPAGSSAEARLSRESS